MEKFNAVAVAGEIQEDHITRAPTTEHPKSLSNGQSNLGGNTMAGSIYIEFRAISVL